MTHQTLDTTKARSPEERWTRIKEQYLAGLFKASKAVRSAAECHAGWKEAGRPGFDEVRPLSLHL